MPYDPRCLKKSVGKNCLFYDELLTLVTEVLNSRPLTYVSSEDIEEPLTPSHLLGGYRILTLPDPPIPDDQDYSPEGLTRRMSHLSRILQHFWNRWKREYLLELREFHCTCKERGSTYIVKEGDDVTEYDPRGFWRLGKIESHAWIRWSGPGCLCKSDVKERTPQDFAQTATTHLPS